MRFSTANSETDRSQSFQSWKRSQTLLTCSEKSVADVVAECAFADESSFMMMMIMVVSVDDDEYYPEGGGQDETRVF